MKRLCDVFDGLLDELVEEAARRVAATQNPYYAGLALPALQRVVRRAFEAIRQDLESGEPVCFTELMAARGRQLSSQGERCRDILEGIGLGLATVSEVLRERMPEDTELRLAWESVRVRATASGLGALADGYLEAREGIVRAQAKEILELSVRVLPLSRGVLLMPLVGHLDTERAERMVGALLSAVGEHQSRVVLLDLTGLPSVNLEVASHLARAAAAVRLLGATPAVVGLRASMAAEMARGGIDFGGVKTLSTLEEGFRYARQVLKSVQLE